MFDPNDIFTLKSRRYIYNATNGARGDDKPEIKDGLSIPLPDSLPEPYHGGKIHEPDATRALKSWSFARMNSSYYIFMAQE